MGVGVGLFKSGLEASFRVLVPMMFVEPRLFLLILALSNFVR